MSNNETKGNEQEHSVYIHKLTLSRHPYISDVCIDTKQKKKHIIITGKNGVGKSTLLNEIKSAVQVSQGDFKKHNLVSIRQAYFEHLERYQSETDPLIKRALEPKLKSQLNNVTSKATFCDLDYNNQTAVDLLKGQAAIQAFFNAKRTTEFGTVESVGSTKITPQEIDQPLSSKFKQHLVNSRSQFAFAQVDGEEEEAKNLNTWFTTLDEFMSDIFDEPVKLHFDRKALNYKIESQDGSQLDFNHLSEGYAAILNIVTEIIMRMEAIEHGNFTLPGIVLIDEIETHLHVQLQKKILRLLSKFFPNIQFIVTTHSPFVLTSSEDAVIYDMETNSYIDAKEDLWQYSYEDIVEGYFDTESYSVELENRIARLEELAAKDSSSLSVKENKELLILKSELQDVPTFKLADIELRLQALGLKK
ncbi:MAG: putative ATP-binding protein involved in virulence [Phenylobacterium sp.]|jgi:predicted ATP-binding protein involved in virulence